MYLNTNAPIWYLCIKKLYYFLQIRHQILSGNDENIAISSVPSQKSYSNRKSDAAYTHTYIHTGKRVVLFALVLSACVWKCLNKLKWGESSKLNNLWYCSQFTIHTQYKYYLKCCLQPGCYNPTKHSYVCTYGHVVMHSIYVPVMHRLKQDQNCCQFLM